VAAEVEPVTRSPDCAEWSRLDKADARNDLVPRCGCGSEVLDASASERSVNIAAPRQMKRFVRASGPVFELALQSDGASRIAASMRRNKEIPADDISNCRTSRMC